MRWPAFALACMLAVAAAFPQAQTSTAEGVDAFVRGDYQRAADSLMPIAEQYARHDHIAEFFMATMYANGLGVPVDAMRACALFMRASANREGPFGKQAASIVLALHQSLGANQFEECRRLSRIGFDHQFQPETFQLETGYSIALDINGATIWYAGKEKRIDTGLARDGDIFLPLLHTEVQVGPSRSTRRHFIEIFVWRQSADWQTWKLEWNLFEVVRDELIGITTADTLMTSASKPSADPPSNLHDLASVRVNDDGNAEWVVRDGRPKAQAIESDAERQEVRQLALTRKAADARVDWTRVPDIHRNPAMTYTDADGCGNTFTFGWSDDRTEAITVRADRDLLQLSTTAKTFDVAAQRSGLEIALHLYDRPLREWPFCTDVGRSGLHEEIWRATRGTITIELSQPGGRVRAPFLYRAAIRISGAEFVNDSGVRVREVLPITLTALVGGFGG
jgi:hypothetical protein